MECFLPSEVSFSDISAKRAFIGAFSFGRENMTSLRIEDLNPTSEGVSTESNAIAILLNAWRRIASSCGVHCRHRLGGQKGAHRPEIGATYLPILNAT